MDDVIIVDNNKYQLIIRKCTQKKSRNRNDLMAKFLVLPVNSPYIPPQIFF